MGWMAAPRRERHALGAARMWPFAGLLGRTTRYLHEPPLLVEPVLAEDAGTPRI